MFLSYLTNGYSQIYTTSQPDYWGKTNTTVKDQYGNTKGTLTTSQPDYWGNTKTVVKDQYGNIIDQ